MVDGALRESSWGDRLTGAALGGIAGFMVRDLVVDSFASCWLIGVLLGALLWAGPRRAPLAGLLGVLFALWLAVAFTPLAARAAAPLVRRDPPAPADAVIVLASRLQVDGEPSAAALSRLVHGLELAREGPGRPLVVSEPVDAGQSHAALARSLAARLGLAPEIVDLGPVRRTHDEALAAAALCARRGWGRLLVVTSPTHSRRACASLARGGLDVVCSPAMETEFDLQTLDRPSERFVAFRALLHEWAGLWYYRRRGWA